MEESAPAKPEESEDPRITELRGLFESARNSANKFTGSAADTMNQIAAQTEDVLNNIEALSSAKEVVNTVKQQAELKAQNMIIDTISSTNSFKNQADLLKEYNEGAKELLDLQARKEDIADDEFTGIGVIDTAINQFRNTSINYQLAVKNNNQNRTLRTIQGIAEATNSISTTANNAKKSINQGTIAAESKAIAATYNIEAARAKIEGLSTNADMMYRMSTASSAQLNMLANIHQIEADIKRAPIELARAQLGLETSQAQLEALEYEATLREPRAQDELASYAHNVWKREQEKLDATDRNDQAAYNKQKRVLDLAAAERDAAMAPVRERILRSNAKLTAAQVEAIPNDKLIQQLSIDSMKASIASTEQSAEFNKLSQEQQQAYRQVRTEAVNLGLKVFKPDAEPFSEAYINDVIENGRDSTLLAQINGYYEAGMRAQSDPFSRGTYGSTPYDAFKMQNLTNPRGGLPDTKGNRLLIAVAQRVEEGKMAGTYTIGASDEEAYKAAFNYEASVYMKELKANVTPESELNLPPLFAYSKVNEVTRQPLWQKVLAPSGMNEFDSQKIFGLSARMIANKVITIEEFVTGMSALINAGKIINNFGPEGFSKYGFQPQDLQNEIKVPIKVVVDDNKLQAAATNLLVPDNLAGQFFWTAGVATRLNSTLNVLGGGKTVTDLTDPSSIRDTMAKILKFLPKEDTEENQ